MHPLGATELLAVWERGLSQAPPLRAAVLLAPVCASTTLDEIATRPIGWRDARLLTLRQQIFGPHFDTVSECPACGERIEVQFCADDIRVPITKEMENSSETMTFTHAGHEISFRLPNSLDLAAVTSTSSTTDARRELFQRCVLGARKVGGEQIAAAKVPDEILSAVASRMTELDPQADVQLALSCPQCRHEWEAPFDIAAFLWSELQSYAQRLLIEVHELASAYGWREADILNMSAARRQAYLQLLHA